MHNWKYKLVKLRRIKINKRINLLYDKCTIINQFFEISLITISTVYTSG